MHSGFTWLALLVSIFLCSITGCSSSLRYTRQEQGIRPSFQENAKQQENEQSTITNPSNLVGTASYYGPGFHGKKTASGERYNMYALTAAHKTLPFNTNVRVTNLTNNMSVVVRINDRGPYKKGRIIDLSHAAAKKIGLIRTGTAKVNLKIIK